MKGFKEELRAIRKAKDRPTWIRSFHRADNNFVIGFSDLGKMVESCYRFRALGYEIKRHRV